MTAHSHNDAVRLAQRGPKAPSSASSSADPEGTDPERRVLAHEPAHEAASEDLKVAHTRLKLTRRAGIWEVTKDGHFYGHYHAPQHAFDAVEAAAHDIVAGGSFADILRRGDRPLHGADGRAGLSGVEPAAGDEGPAIARAAGSAHPPS